MTKKAYEAVLFTPGPFQNQLQYVCDYTNTLCPFQFPLMEVRVSVQAGWGMASIFYMHGKERDYPFLHAADADWRVEELFEDYTGPDRHTKREVTQRKLFPLKQATAFEVALMRNRTTDVDDFPGMAWLTLKDIDIHLPPTAASYWEDESIGRLVPVEVVQQLLEACHHRETALAAAQRERASTRIQKCYKGWLVRKKTLWNPHHPLGRVDALRHFEKLNVHPSA